jgi:sugar phosphate isomerase/epimerase
MELQFSTACLPRLPLYQRFALAQACELDGLEVAVAPGMLRRGPDWLPRLSECYATPVRSVALESVDRLLADGATASVLTAFVTTLPLCRTLVVPAPAAAGGLDRYLGLLSALSAALAGRVVVTIANAPVRGPEETAGPLDRFPQLRRIVEEWDLGFTYDTSHAASNGWVITEPLPQMGTRLRNVHLSDFRQTPGERPRADAPLLPDHVQSQQVHRPLGDGVLPLRAFLRTLRRRDYTGLVTITGRERGWRAWWSPLARARLVAAVSLCRAAVQEIDPIRANQIGRALSTPAEREGIDDRG